MPSGTGGGRDGESGEVAGTVVGGEAEGAAGRM